MEAIFFNDWKNAYIPQILEEIYLKGVYHPFLRGKQVEVIVDWGANIGLASYYFKNYAKQVYAVEPSVMHQESLQTMLDYNKITNVKLCKYAISNENGKTKFYHNPNTTAFMLNDNAVADKNDYEEVETVTVDEFMKREGIEHIDLLKFDTEGEESQIIASESFQNAASKIDVIVGEWHNWTQMNQEQFANAFRDLGFEFKWLPNMEASVFTAVKI